MSHTAIMIAANRKIVRSSGLLALVVVSGLAMQYFDRGVTWRAVLPAALLAMTGRQLILAHRMFHLVDPVKARGWMRPAGFALYGIAAFVVLAVGATLAAPTAAP